jgi:integrase
MPLTDPKVKNAKAADNPYKLSDGGGLYLLVQPSGTRLWRLAYRFAGKQKLLALGVYPAVGLKDAREGRERAKAKLRDGIDPSAERQEKKAAQRMAAENSFEVIAREWLAKQHLSDVTRTKALWLFESLTFPWIGNRPITEIKPQDMLLLLRRIEARGKLETAQRVKQQAGRVFRYAVVTGRANDDPTAALRGAIKTPKTRHMAAITDEKQVGPLLRAIDSFDGTFVVACALKLAPMLFVRPGELRRAEWSEFDLDAAEWKIPAAKMKMRSDHIVPLSTQAVAVLRDMHPLTGSGLYVFPSNRGRGRPMSEGTVLAALRRMGYEKDVMSGHGFRAMARTLLAEQGWQPDVIERQLAHKASGPLGEAYDRTRFLPQRRKMMQAWSDYLDSLRRGESKVVSIRAA